MQNERTLKFWDDYHIENQIKEWIVQPTNDLFEVVYARFPCHINGGQSVKVLEIGCGTSTMARDFCQYLQSHKEHDKIDICATDVSEVCIDVSTNRDEDFLGFAPSQASYPPNTACASNLSYRVLNLLEQPAEKDLCVWNIIMDKACLDTFLFRSRQRGENRVYPASLQIALDNLWSMLTNDGVYMLISPRTKLKAVRDYAGFAKVEIVVIHSEAKGSIESKKNVKKTKEDEPCYLYVCRKNPDYKIGETKTFKTTHRELPTDDTNCPHCDMKFGDFRRGEDVDGRGVVVWTREWKNHCIHCKAPHTPK